MINNLLMALTLLSALGSGLIAGVFFAFSSFVMSGLGRLPAPHGVAAMQSINVAVINPLFLGVFLGTAAACALLVVAALFKWQEPGAMLLLAGALLYFIGTFLVTMVFNVPLNDALAAAAPDSADGASLWARYHGLEPGAHDRGLRRSGAAHGRALLAGAWSGAGMTESTSSFAWSARGAKLCEVKGVSTVGWVDPGAGRGMTQRKNKDRPLMLGRRIA
jgi:uncharacterized membrane protein